MFDGVPFQGDQITGTTLAIDLNPGHPVFAAVRVLDLDRIDCLTVTIAQAETRPACRDDRSDPHLVATHLHPQDLFDPGPIHPRRRAGVPGPAPLTDPAGQPVDIGRHHVRFNAVPPGRRRIAGVLDRIEYPQQAHRPLPVAAAGHGHGQPQRGMGVLPAIFPHSRGIPLDIAR